MPRPEGEVDRGEVGERDEPGQPLERVPRIGGVLADPNAGVPGGTGDGVRQGSRGSSTTSAPSSRSSSSRSFGDGAPSRKGSAKMSLSRGIPADAPASV